MVNVLGESEYASLMNPMGKIGLAELGWSFSCFGFLTVPETSLRHPCWSFFVEIVLKKKTNGLGHLSPIGSMGLVYLLTMSPQNHEK